MENVHLIHSKENYPHLLEWIKALERLGYQSYWQDLNATDYGVPQNRNRTFMVSILGDYNYTFPKKFGLELRLKDLLESEVDEKYYLSDKMIQYISQTGTGGYANADCKINLDIARPITTDPNKMAGTTNYLCNELPNGFNLAKIKQNRLYGIFDTENVKHQAGSVWDIEGLCPTLDTMQGGYRQLCIQIPEATKKGYAEAYKGDSVYINRPHQKRGVVQKGLNQTLKTSCDDVGVVLKVGNYSPSGSYMYSVESKNNLKLKLNTEYKKLVETIEKNELNINEVKHLDLYNRSVTENYGTLTDPKHNSNRLWDGLRIRKLTPRECLKLMGLKNEDIVNISKNQSDSSLYHLAGDSIVTTCLMAIFGELLGIDWQSKISEVIKDLCYTNIN
jgi:DNA (cytosine-5)-methyltransferase 1